MERITFTLDEARALLPWLEDKFREMAEARGEESRLQLEAANLMRESRSNGKSGMERRMARVNNSVEEAMTRSSGLVQEILDRGIIVRNVGAGLVDFRSYLDGEDVFLCWVRGEDDIRFWHGTNEGYASRRPL